MIEISWLYCEYCGKRFSSKYRKAGNQKYCSKECAKNANREKTANRIFKKRHSENNPYKYVVPSEWVDKHGKPIREFSYIVELGSKGTSLSEHRNPDFDKEAELIRKEKKRLGLK